MKKNFKQSFGVTGTPAQIKAFKEYAESVGWVCQYFDGAYNCLYFSHDGENAIKAGCFWTAWKDKLITTYHLPSQWAEAMQAASIVEIVWEKGDWAYISQAKTSWRAIEIEGDGVRFENGVWLPLSTLTPATPEEIEAARKPTFERGEKVISKYGTIVLCDGRHNGAYFSGTEINGDRAGEHLNEWNKDTFTLHTSPVTL